MHVQLPTDRYHYTPHSKNKKLGGIPATIFPRKFCSNVTCAFRGNGCYAENFPMSRLWNKISDGTWGDDFDTFLAKLRTIPYGQLWRHAQAGEAPIEAFLPVARAARRARGFGYTHHQCTPESTKLLKDCAALNLRINYSCDTLEEADRVVAAGMPAVTVLESSEGRVAFDSPAGNRVVVCPNSRNERVTCATCQLCYERKAGIVIGFPAHGTKVKAADLVVSSQHNQQKTQDTVNVASDLTLSR